MNEWSSESTIKSKQINSTYTSRIRSPFRMPALSAAPSSRTAETCCRGAYNSPDIDLRGPTFWNLSPDIETKSCFRLADWYDPRATIRWHDAIRGLIYLSVIFDVTHCRLCGHMWTQISTRGQRHACGIRSYSWPKGWMMAISVWFQ